MTNFLSIRRWERPDRPQQVYTGQLSLFEAPTYVPMGSQLHSFRMADRKVDKMSTLQTVPDDGWLPKVVDGALATFVGIFQAELASYRMVGRPVLDVRRVEQPGFGWIVNALPAGATVVQMLPAVQVQSYRVGERPKLDVRYVFQPSLAWIQNVTIVPPTVAQQWPAILPESMRFRSRERAKLDVRSVSQPSPSAWIKVNLPLFPAAWPGPHWQRIASVPPEERRSLVKASRAQ